MQITSRTRLAQLNDVSDTIDVLREFFDNSPFQDFHFDEKKVRALCEYAIVDPKRMILIVSVDDNDKIVGLLAGRIDEAPFSDDKVAIETAWYIKPEFRHGRRAIELFDAFEAWARAVGAVYLYYGTLVEMPKVDNDALDRFYRHQGCRPVERGYVKRLI